MTSPNMEGQQRLMHTSSFCFLTPHSPGGEPAVTAFCGCRPPPSAFRGRFEKSMKRPPELLHSFKSPVVEKRNTCRGRDACPGRAAPWAVPVRPRWTSPGVTSGKDAERGRAWLRFGPGSGTPEWMWHPLLSHHTQKTPNYPLWHLPAASASVSSWDTEYSACGKKKTQLQLRVSRCIIT